VIKLAQVLHFVQYDAGVLGMQRGVNGSRNGKWEIS